MEPIISFLLAHWMLSGAFVAILILLALNEWRQLSLGMKGIDHQELVHLLNHIGAVAIDIRSPERYNQGHIRGAMNIPQESFVDRLSSISKYKNKMLILICATGVDAPKIGQLLTRQGFTQKVYLSGGMTNWVSNGMPVVKK
ncbi:MAG: rhodanese-like domain-containing protein [Candidatus Berkiellales bacterium]